jgi:hypothetical protein
MTTDGCCIRIFFNEPTVRVLQNCIWWQDGLFSLTPLLSFSLKLKKNNIMSQQDWK